MEIIPIQIIIVTWKLFCVMYFLHTGLKYIIRLALLLTDFVSQNFLTAILADIILLSRLQCVLNMAKFIMF